MTRQIRILLDRGWIMGVVAVVLVVAAIGATSVVASADEPLRPAIEPIPAIGTPFGLQSWPHGTCVDSNDTDAYSLGCNGGPYQRYAMRAGSILDPNGAPITLLLQQNENEATGRCLESDDAGAVYPSICQGDNMHQQWTLEVSYRDWDGRAVLHFQNSRSQRWLAVGDDIYATGDATSLDRDFAIQW